MPFPPYNITFSEEWLPYFLDHKHILYPSQEFYSPVGFVQFLLLAPDPDGMSVRQRTERSNLPSYTK